METATLTTKGQIVIPKNIRKKYQFTTGVQVLFEETEHGVIIRPIDKNYLDHIINKVGKGFPATKEYLKWKSEDNKLEEPAIKYERKKLKKKK